MTGKECPAPPKRNPVAKSLRDRSKAQRIVSPRKGKGSYRRKGRDKDDDKGQADACPFGNDPNH